MGQSNSNVKLTTFFHLIPWLRGQGPTGPVPHMSTWLAQGQVYRITWSPASLLQVQLLLFCGC